MVYWFLTENELYGSSGPLFKNPLTATIVYVDEGSPWSEQKSVIRDREGLHIPLYPPSTEIQNICFLVIARAGQIEGSWYTNK